MYFVEFVDPNSNTELTVSTGKLVSRDGCTYAVINSIPRFYTGSNYADSFGFQWEKFSRTQFDNFSGRSITERRFYAATNWRPECLKSECVLECGSGAGRFTEVYLRTTEGYLHTVDVSSAVDVNLKLNNTYRHRLKICQASVYALPFPDNSFDKIFCFGMLQHTPDPAEAIRQLASKAKKHAQIVVDFYSANSVFTHIHFKYFARPLTKRLPPMALLRVIQIILPTTIICFDFLCRIGLGFMTRFLPIVDLRTLPADLSRSQRLEWAILDTFDAYSPYYDTPLRISDVVQFFHRNGCMVSFSGLVEFHGGKTTVVRATKL